jgi:hypothetical protein
MDNVQHPHDSASGVTATPDLPWTPPQQRTAAELGESIALFERLLALPDLADDPFTRLRVEDCARLADRAAAGSVMTCPTTTIRPRGGQSPWLLPDDGIIDPIAVDLAARGVRRVALTLPERRAAARAILARGECINQVAKRLHVSGTTALALIA